MLVAASGLLLRSFEKMRAVALGFSPEHLLVASYALPQQQYSSQAVVNEFNHELLRRLEALPGMQSGGLSSVSADVKLGGTLCLRSRGLHCAEGSQHQRRQRLGHNGELLFHDEDSPIAWSVFHRQRQR